MTATLENLDGLDFGAFQRVRAQLLVSDPTLIDCGETNLWRSLAALVPKVPEQAAERVHRCHLAQQWLQHWGFDADLAPRALVSTGVRHSLSLIFAQLAANGLPLILPSDVYPVYGELARAANLPFQTFETLTGKKRLQFPDTEGWLVLPLSLKPNGRVLGNGEHRAVLDWLAADKRRRIIFDAVYTFDKMLDATILDAQLTGQTVILHSLSKSWLQTKIFGVALVSEADQQLFTETFRANSPTQLQLTQARHLMARYPRLPLQIFGELKYRRELLLKKLPAPLQSHLHLPNGSWHDGYLLSIEQSASQLLAEHRLLAIPASVFGSTRADCSILSSLAFGGS